MCAETSFGVSATAVVVVEEGVVDGAVETEKVFVHIARELKTMVEEDVAHRFVPANGGGKIVEL